MTLLRGDCLALLPTLGNASVDSIVTDPPYELGFMGKSWDNSGIAYNVDLWRECLRVLKPGGHLLAFGGSRTYHRLACAIEDAGFEIRDQIMWINGSGFPKSLDVSKAIDNAAGAERPDRVPDRVVDFTAHSHSLENPRRVPSNAGAPVTDDAKRWQGWGTALKPAHEPIVVARKPFTGTVASNVLEWGTGALNIDGCRVGTEPTLRVSNSGTNGDGWGMCKSENVNRSEKGRWPANVIHDGSDEVVAGFATSDDGVAGKRNDNGSMFNLGVHDEWGGYGGSGSAARFFYCAKADRAEREQGLAWASSVRHSDGQSDEGAGGDNPRNRTNEARKNFHPTVKPLDLMRYLVRLVTPPNGVVLDPFLGSGTTAVAAILAGFDWLGCEMTEDYWPIIEARVRWANEQGHHARLFT